MITPERRAEIENQVSWWKGKYGSGRYADRVMEVDGVNHLSDLGEFSEFGTELLAEIDRLTAENAQLTQDLAGLRRSVAEHRCSDSKYEPYERERGYF